MSQGCHFVFLTYPSEQNALRSKLAHYFTIKLCQHVFPSSARYRPIVLSNSQFTCVDLTGLNDYTQAYFPRGDQSDPNITFVREGRMLGLEWAWNGDFRIPYLNRRYLL